MRTLQVVGSEHDYTNAQYSCEQIAAVSRYLLTGRVPPTDLSCPHVMPAHQQPLP